MTSVTPEPSPTPVGRVARVYRYPVKSLVGERLDTVLVEQRGLRGDRFWSVRDPDGKLGSGKSSRRFRKMDGLLALAARYDGDVPVIDLPDGRTLRGDDPSLDRALSAHVGRPVGLGREADVSHFDDGPIHLLTSATLERLGQAHGSPVDERRFRPNLVLDVDGPPGFPEDTWVGSRIAIGDGVVLGIEASMPRCVMVDLDQRDVTADGRLLRTVTDVNDANAGVLAVVVHAGVVSVGDEVRLLVGGRAGQSSPGS